MLYIYFEYLMRQVCKIFLIVPEFQRGWEQPCVQVQALVHAARPGARHPGQDAAVVSRIVRTLASVGAS